MEYKKPSKKNLFRHLRQNVVDSHNGLRIMIEESSTFQRIYPLMLGGGLLLGLFCDFVALEYAILAGVFIVDVITETMNSAVEELCDRVTKERDDYIKRTKDIASAAVYIAHLSYIAAAVFFAVSHLTGFDWWAKLIPV